MVRQLLGGAAITVLVGLFGGMWKPREMQRRDHVLNKISTNKLTSRMNYRVVGQSGDRRIPGRSVSFISRNWSIDSTLLYYESPPPFRCWEAFKNSGWGSVLNNK